MEKDASVLSADAIVFGILDIRIFDAGDDINFGEHNSPLSILVVIKPNVMIVGRFEVDGPSVVRLGNRTTIFDNDVADALVAPLLSALRLLGDPLNREKDVRLLGSWLMSSNTRNFRQSFHQ